MSRSEHEMRILDEQAGRIEDRRTTRRCQVHGCILIIGRNGIVFNKATCPSCLDQNAPEMLEALEAFINQGYCPSCGCDLWNTKGCPVCPKMRAAYDLLVKLGRRDPRQYAEYVEADPINIRNMGGQ